MTHPTEETDLEDDATIVIVQVASETFDDDTDDEETR